MCGLGRARPSGRALGGPPRPGRRRGTGAGRRRSPRPGARPRSPGGLRLRPEQRRPRALHPRHLLRADAERNEVVLRDLGPADDARRDRDERPRSRPSASHGSRRACRGRGCCSSPARPANDVASLFWSSPPMSPVSPSRRRSTPLTLRVRKVGTLIGLSVAADVAVVAEQAELRGELQGDVAARRDARGQLEVHPHVAVLKARRRQVAPARRCRRPGPRCSS